MKILISIFFILAILILTSKIKINMQYLNKDENSFKIRFKMKFGFYLFGFFKIIGITLTEKGIHFLFFRIAYQTLKIEKDSVKFLKEISLAKILKSLNVKLNTLNLQLKIGSEDMLVTVFLVFAISTLLSILFAKNQNHINIKNTYYKIIPVYNMNSLSFQLSTQISIKTFNIIRTWMSKNKFMKYKKENNLHKKEVLIKI